MDLIIGYLEDFKDALLLASVTIATLGFLGLGMMYLLSPIPVLAEWRTNNPKAFSQVTIGLIILIFASGASIAGLLGT
jgi:hypothetical protein